MKSRIYLCALISVLIAATACSQPWQQLEAIPIPPPIEVEVPTNTVPAPTPIIENTETEIPTEEPVEITNPCGPGMVNTTALSVEFCYPGEYINGHTEALIPANPATGEGPEWAVNPDMIEITLTGYPVTNEYHDPKIFIYPVDDFIALEPRIQTVVDELQALLASEDPQPTAIPFVPMFNAAQMMRAKATYLNFNNGKGVRFITQYSQAAMPVSNDSAFYAFIGLTDDGSYLVSATLPITHPLFYADMFTEPTGGWEAFVENFSTYISTMELELSKQPRDSFFPNLAPLDNMMASFLIPPGTIPNR